MLVRVEGVAAKALTSFGGELNKFAMLLNLLLGVEIVSCQVR